MTKWGRGSGHFRHWDLIRNSSLGIRPDFHVGFQDAAESRTAMQHEVKARFRAEFINRVDEQIVFRPLNEEDARRILRPMLDAISEELRKRHAASSRNMTPGRW
jgi:ATP-dependent Clp protease ATP-binding subunit ClpA